MPHLYIVFEDKLGEYVIRKMIQHIANDFYCTTPMGNRGNGYIKKKIKSLNRLNDSMLFFVLTDLDNHECVPSMIQKWIAQPIRNNLLFRVAVREVETWLLADSKGFAQFLKLDKSFIEKEIREIDNINNPKEKLISLVKRSKQKNLKEDIVNNDTKTVKQGPAYNSCLQVYINNFWDIDRAKKKSNSLFRALNALLGLTKRVKNE